jgi:glycerol-3-phosphate dehydrogenase
MRLRDFHGSFDLVIVGGGVIGAGIARDAALRGLRTALVDRADFGGATTAGSTRLIHGGLRYLETLDLRLVRLDLRERETLLRIAAHLVRPLPFLLPLYEGGGYSRATLRAGLLLYDALSWDKSLPRHQFLDAAETADLEPGLRRHGLKGAAMYHDAQISSPERLALENVLDAAGHGAVVRNYVEVRGAIERSGRIGGVRVADTLTGEQGDIEARVVVNASGPWFDAVASRLTPSAGPRVRTTKGIHIACEPLTRHALLLRSPLDRRAFFAMSWMGLGWIGTTDTDYGDDPAAVRACAHEIRYLLDSAADYLPQATAVRCHWSCAGVRALVRRAGPESRSSRMHRIVEGPAGLVSIIGGKITGYRAIAEEVTDRVCREIGVRARAVTARQPLPGACSRPSSSDHLAAIYGGRADQVRELARGESCLNEPLSPQYPDIAAQVVHAVRKEHCLRLEDFMLRRSFLGFRPDRGRCAAEAVSRRMQLELGWSEDERRREVEAFRDTIGHDAAEAINLESRPDQSRVS